MKTKSKRTKAVKPDVADRIAADLFTNGAGRIAETLLMVKNVGTSDFYDLGGWSQSAVADRIRKFLTPIPPKPRRKR